MKNAHRLTLYSFLSLTIALDAAAQGIMPIPQIDVADIDTTVEIVPAAGAVPTQYIYRYAVTNPSSSQDGYYKFSIDISAPRRDNAAPAVTTIPSGGGTTTISFSDEVDFFYPFLGPQGDGVVSIGLECPTSWNGGLRKNGIALCHASTGAPIIDPNTTMTGFTIHSRMPPTLRDVETTAFWILEVPDGQLGQVTDTEREQAFLVQETLKRPQRGLGPSYIFPSDRRHYTQFEKDLDEMIDLGWIPNTTLANDLITIIDGAGDLFNAAQGSAAKLMLNDAVVLLATATAADITPEAATHLSVNISAIQEFGANTLPPGGVNTRYRLSPRNGIENVGDTITFETFVFRLNNYDFVNGVFEEALEGRTVYYRCDRFAPVPAGVDPCPNFPDPLIRFPVVTDVNGVAAFSYVGNTTGRDHIDICGDSSCEGVVGEAIIDWISDVDLVVPGFSPSVIKAQSGDVIEFSDITANIGPASAPPSVTRYYISDSQNVNPLTATVVGDRPVPALAPGESHEIAGLQLTLPAGFSEGFHYLLACADSDLTIAESNEDNNCSDADLRGISVISIPFAPSNEVALVSVSDVSIAEGNSGTTDALIDVTIDGKDLTAAYVIDFLISDGTATQQGGDYAATASGAASFLPGPSPQTIQIPVTINGDILQEDDENLFVSVSASSLTSNLDVGILDGEGVVTIIDDDGILPLDCASAEGVPAMIWPPNHKLVDIDIEGVVGNDGEEPVIVVDGVFQDEVVEGLGDGNTQPDAFISAFGDVKVRAERSGLEDGRIYEINFTATGNDGATCSGSVIVGVPHDKSQGSVPIDSIVRYDSTSPTN